MFSRIQILLTLIHLASGEQPGGPAPIAAPLRELPWGQLNFLHTTDTHGWHGGHLQEPQYAADWGDYISFAQHLRKRADADGSDLLIIDSGDRVEGNGLYDASDPKGEYTFDIIKHQTMDVITMGNHELYKRSTSEREYTEVVPDFKGSYLASNLDIYDPKSGKLVPLAPRFRKFTTKNQGIRVMAFGFLFDFKGNANNTVVQPVKETVKEQWFQDALREKDVDLYVVAGHVPVRNSPEFDAIFGAIRDVQWDTPIVFFGGHTHIRDYKKYDKKAVALESGRYMETLGFVSVSGLSTSKKDVVSATASTKFERRYIDNNLFSLHHHSNTNKSTFDTALGQNVSKAIHEARKELKLDHAFGCAPNDYWLNRAPYPSGGSLLSWLEREVIPDTFGKANSTPSLVITNSGAIRFDIFKGPFTIDSTYLVSPFTSGFRKVESIPYDAARQVLKILNNEGQILLDDMSAAAASTPWEPLRPARPPVSASSMSSSRRQFSTAAERTWDPMQQTVLDGGEADEEERQKKPQVPGYTTQDDAGDDGDDTVHAPIQFFNVPNCIASEVGFRSGADEKDRKDGGDELPNEVDLVYNEFIQNWILLALKYVGVSKGVEDTKPALEGKTMTDVISGWVHEHWACDEK